MLKYWNFFEKCWRQHFFWNFVFIKCFINLLYTIVPNINVIEQFSWEIWVLKFASNLRFSPSNIFSCCRHPSVLCDILAMPPPQTTHLCFLKPLIIYLTSEHSDNFFLSRWYLPQKNAWSITESFVVNVTGLVDP